MKRTSLYILSPLLILAVTQITAIIAGQFLGAYSYIPVILIYWMILGFILYKYGTLHIGDWLGRLQGHWGWIILAMVTALSSLPLFLRYFHLLREASVLIPTIVFFLINPWLEEFYWRGILTDLTKDWSPLISVLYSSILFTLWHAAFAWQSVLSRGIVFYSTVLVLGIIMVILYRKTKSLRLCIASHMIINILNLSIPSLLNMIDL